MKIGIGIEPVYSRRRSGFGASPNEVQQVVDQGIVRTPKGTFKGAASDGTGITFASGVSVEAGSTLVVFLRYDITTGDIALNSVTWNGHVMPGFGSDRSRIYYLMNAPAGTGDIVGDDSSNGLVDSWQGIVTEYSGVPVSSIDVAKMAFEAGTTPSTGASVATAVANEMVVGCIGWNRPTVSGVWSGGYNAGEKVEDADTSNAIEEAYLVLSTTGAQTLAKTGCDSALWGASIITLKRAAVATSVMVTSDTNPAALGATVTFTATMSPVGATGTVQFKSDGTNIGTVVTLVAGVATVSTSSLSLANHTITAVYSGSVVAGYAASTGTMAGLQVIR